MKAVSWPPLHHVDVGLAHRRAGRIRAERSLVGLQVICLLSSELAGRNLILEEDVQTTSRDAACLREAHEGVCRTQNANASIEKRRFGTPAPTFVRDGVKHHGGKEVVDEVDGQ